MIAWTYVDADQYRREVAREIVMRRYTREHEAAHAAACIALDVELIEIHAARPTRKLLGRVIHRWAPPHEVAMITLAGPITDDTVITPRWPLLAEESTDEARLVRLFEDHGWGRRDWDYLNLATRQLIADSTFCRAESVLASTLEKHPVIEGEFLKAVVEIIQNHERTPCNI